ncbi:MAG: GGDEF domain-containing protein [Tissierellia bacterium]|nr:GGDEF domain-containing protein [Tissierellia bacterium]
MGKTRYIFKNIIPLSFGFFWILQSPAPIEAQSVLGNNMIQAYVPIIMQAYGGKIFWAMALILLALSLSVIYNIRINRQLRMRNRKNEILSQISNEYLYEYHVRSDRLELSKKCIQLFGEKDGLSQAKDMLKQVLLTEESNNSVQTIEWPIADGKVGIFRMVNFNIFDSNGNLDSIVGKLIDISKEVAEKEELIIKAQSDGLTGLYNDMTTRELIAERIRSKDEEDMDALMIVDCDEFKDINDTHGHLVGDQVLINIGNAFKFTFRKTDIIGRIGGDEFCIYIKNIPSVDFIESKNSQLSKLIQELNEGIDITISTGVAFVSDERTYEELFAKADEALYRAKMKGGAQNVIYIERQYI